MSISTLFIINAVVIIAMIASISFLVKESEKSMLGVASILMGVPLIYSLFLIPLVITNGVYYFATDSKAALVLLILSVIGLILPFLFMILSSKMDERKLEKRDKHYKNLLQSYLDEFSISWIYEHEGNRELTIIVRNDLDEEQKSRFSNILDEVGIQNQKVYFLENRIMVQL